MKWKELRNFLNSKFNNEDIINVVYDNENDKLYLIRDKYKPKYNYTNSIVLIDNVNCHNTEYNESEIVTFYGK